MSPGHLRELFADSHGPSERVRRRTDLEGSFRHARSGVSYRVFRQGQRAVLSYERTGSSALLGTQELKYYVGSNTRGRTFLFEIDGFLYQSPINYYAEKRIWDMSPGYAQLRRMELSHPVDAHLPLLSRKRSARTHEGHHQPLRRGPVPARRCWLRAMSPPREQSRQSCRADGQPGKADR